MKDVVGLAPHVFTKRMSTADAGLARHLKKPKGCYCGTLRCCAANTFFRTYITTISHSIGVSEAVDQTPLNHERAERCPQEQS
jgi:hypothetical protein